MHLQSVFEFHLKNETPTIIHKTIVYYRERKKMLKWLLLICKTKNFCYETYFLTVAIFDKYCRDKIVLGHMLHLIGATSFFIAQKYHEVGYFFSNTVASFTNGLFTKFDILEMEIEILNKIKFDLSSPTIMTFILLFDLPEQLLKPVIILAVKIQRRHKLLVFLPSLLTCALIYMQNEQKWPEKWVKFSGYQISDFKDIVETIITQK